MSSCTVGGRRLARVPRDAVGVCAQTDVKINENNTYRHRITEQSEARERWNTEAVRRGEKSSHSLEASNQRIRGSVLTPGLHFYT